MLEDLLLTKAAINFQIKEWAQGRADGSLPKTEFEGGIVDKQGNPVICPTLNWKKLPDGSVEPQYSNSIRELYNLPDWVIEAVEKQKMHILREKYGSI